MVTARAFLSAALILTASATAAGAIEPAKISADNPLLGQVRAGLSAGDFVAGVLQAFDDVSRETGVITAQDMRDRQAIQAAARRASALSAVMRYDLDGDLRVVTAEIVTARTIGSQKPFVARGEKSTVKLARAEADRLMQQYDANADGAINIMEVTQASLPEENLARDSMILGLLSTELGKDRKLTRLEVKAFAERTFKAIDTDKNGYISAEEYAAVQPANG